MRNLCVALGSGLVIVGIGAPGLAADDAAARGAKVYAQNCAQCHGPNMVDPGNGSFDLRTFPADQHDRFVNSVMNGKRAMPAWDGILMPSQIEDVWAYIVAAKTKPGTPAKK